MIGYVIRWPTLEMGMGVGTVLACEDVPDEIVIRGSELARVGMEFVTRNQREF
jgi:hypothetical protein